MPNTYLGWKRLSTITQIGLHCRSNCPGIIRVFVLSNIAPVDLVGGRKMVRSTLSCEVRSIVSEGI